MYCLKMYLAAYICYDIIETRHVHAYEQWIFIVYIVSSI